MSVTFSKVLQLIFLSCTNGIKSLKATQMINPFVSNASFLYLLKTSENRKVFRFILIICSLIIALFCRHVKTR